MVLYISTLRRFKWVLCDEPREGKVEEPDKVAAIEYGKIGVVMVVARRARDIESIADVVPSNSGVAVVDARAGSNIDDNEPK